MRLVSGTFRLLVRLAVLGATASTLGACGGGGSGSATLSCPTCSKPAASSAPATSPSGSGPVKPASTPTPKPPASSASTAAKAPWPMPPTPQPVQGVLTGQALRDYVLNSARYMIAHPQLMDRTPTIAGITNAHGIRVDIYNWIQGLPMTPAQKAAMVQEAHAAQDAILVDSKNLNAVTAVNNESAASANCLGDSLRSAFNGHDWSDAIDLLTANTQIRQQAYMAYNNAQAGPIALPSGNTCKSY